jgi:2-dehydro-3-deoxy-D-arabinonate dehydratase
MKLAKCRLPDGFETVALLDDDQLTPLDLPADGPGSLAEILEADDARQLARALSATSSSMPLSDATLLPPIDNQEVWAAGVTYQRSQTARMEESETSASCYDRVYQSPRPELFFKASPHRVAGPGQPLRIRQDSRWNVPEPELTLVLNSRLQLVGFTAGNDMSSRDIEGENPLYLPQAKIYQASCGLGPCVTLAEAMPPHEQIGIVLVVRRGGETVYHGQTSTARMARSFENLIEYLGRDNSFPHGVFLMTGTGIVPDSDFTLLPDDVVEINIDGVGALVNHVVQS